MFNLNIFRNAHYQTLNKAKKKCDEELSVILKGLKLPNNIKITYMYFHGTRGRVDLSNVCSIMDKFFSDSLVNHGCIDDDDVKFIPEVSYRFGGYDKGNSHFDIIIESLVKTIDKDK